MHKPLPPHPNVRRCTHIKVNGQRCGSPALRREFFCYFHTLVIKGVQQRVDRQLDSIAMLEDRESIQLSIMLVVDGLVKGTLDPIRARLILQALRLAARNAQHIRFSTPFEVEKQTMVREVPNYARQYLIEHPEYGPPLDARRSDRGAGEAEASPYGPVTPAREAATKSGIQIEAQAKPQAIKKSEASATSPAAKRRKSAAHGASRGTNAETNPAPQERKKPSTSEHQNPKEYKRIKQAQAAIPGAMAGNWRDLKTVFEFAGICQQNKEAT